MLKVRIRSTGILGVVGLTLVTVSHPIPIAMGYELVLAYIAADPGGLATLAATADTSAAIAFVIKAAGTAAAVATHHHRGDDRYLRE